MKRTQIYIDEDTFERLEKESKIKHKTISELIIFAVEPVAKVVRFGPPYRTVLSFNNYT
jgi:hypothetical protein